MNISIIVAMSKNRVIGKNNTMPWHLSDDLKNFKYVTTGKTVIMGSLTYESIGKPLPNRKNIVLSRNLKNSDVIVLDKLEHAIEESKEENEVFIIGGQDIYNQTVGMASKIYLTTINENLQGDKYFPEIDLTNWTLVSTKNYQKNENNSHDFRSEVFIKKTNI